MSKNTYQERLERTKWMMEDRFGMFIHWGIYSIPARGEWVRSVEKISIEDYQTYFDEFNPVNYNPQEWAGLAKKAGMKYAVLTAKHHDGFCLFDSQLTDYKATNTPAGRDLVREYVDAFRAEGIKVGLYYSLIDWHHPDFPTYKDNIHPMRGNEAFKNHQYNMERYNQYFHGQVKELLTNYGKIDIMWFDFSYDQENDDLTMSGETWEAAKLVTMIRELQPEIIIDNRLELDLLRTNIDTFTTDNVPIYRGDFVSPEQTIPPQGVTDKNGKSIPWEACITMNNGWGFKSADRDYKSAKTIIRALVECSSKSGNLLLNVGPTAKGEIPPESVEILEQVGKWMDQNGESIYGASHAELEKPEWGRLTRKGKRLFAHILDRGIGAVSIPGFAGKVKAARYLANGAEVNIKAPWYVDYYLDDLHIILPDSSLPDDNDTVVELVLK